MDPLGCKTALDEASGVHLLLIFEVAVGLDVQYSPAVAEQIVLEGGPCH